MGETWNVHGGYLQDWLLRPSDWNWRLDPALGGELRAVADIGSHWLDLVQFVTGLEIVEVHADLATTIPVRQRPTGSVGTFVRSAVGAGDNDVPVVSDDLANVLLRFRGGARGSVVISQVSAGRKNSLRYEIDGSEGAVAWDSERPEELWLGRRDEANAVLLRNPALLESSAAARTTFPAGHAEGFAETLCELFRAVYTSIAAGGPPGEPDYPTFRDGHAANVLGEAIARSSREGRWVPVSAGSSACSPPRFPT
ncbi:MAG: Gfo/Idh/MocA family protein [Gaiellaceae bacterium]